MTVYKKCLTSICQYVSSSFAKATAGHGRPSVSLCFPRLRSGQAGAVPPACDRCAKHCGQATRRASEKFGSNYFLNDKRLEFSLSEASAALAANTSASLSVKAGAASAYPSDILLCRREDSNLQSSRNTVLNRARLPFRHFGFKLFVLNFNRFCIIEKGLLPGRLMAGQQTLDLHIPGSNPGRAASKNWKSSVSKTAPGS